MKFTRQQPNEALHQQRQLRGWSQAKLAELIGTSHDQISRWETGKRFPLPFFQEKLCLVFAMNAQQLGFVEPLAPSRPEEPSPPAHQREHGSHPLSSELQDQERETLPKEADVQPLREPDLPTLSDLPGPTFRIWLCGPFAGERRVGEHYETLSPPEWGGTNYSRLLLKALLCCPGRHARREALLDRLWPEVDPEPARQSLNSATTKLREALRPSKGQDSLLMSESNATVYRLPGQDVLWTDVDAALALVEDAERLGRLTPPVLPLLEEAAEYFQRGAFLEEEEGLWLSSYRASIERARVRTRLWLSEAYVQQGRLGQAEMVLNVLLEEDPTDEEVVGRLMVLLAQQGMTHQALRLYEQTCECFEQEGLELSQAMKRLSERLQTERLSLDIGSPPKIEGTSPLISLQQGEMPFHLEGRTMKQGVLVSHLHDPLPLSIPSFLQTDVDVLARLSLLLNKPSVVNEREIHYFDQQTRLYWRAREETALPATTLYVSVVRHIDDITLLLARSHMPTLRLYLCEIICRTVLLAGILLYDMGQYVKARQQYLVSFQAAKEANNLALQAIIWGWMSFTWTYTKNYTEALHCVLYARSFALQTTDSIMKAWLSAIEAEIQARLYHRDLCLQALSDMEHHSRGGSPSQDISYLFEFNPVLLLGYKGVCLQQFYQRQEPVTHRLLQDAKESLEQALASEAPLKRKLYYLSDLAGVHARQGEVETACSYIIQSIPLMTQVGSGSKTIRKHLLQARTLLQPHEHTSFVQSLDTQMAPLLIEMQTEET